MEKSFHLNYHLHSINTTFFFLNIRVPPEHKPGTYFKISKTLFFLKRRSLHMLERWRMQRWKKIKKTFEWKLQKEKKNSFLLNCFNFLLFIHLILFIHSCWHTTDVYTCIQTITIFYFFIFQGLKWASVLFFSLLQRPSWNITQALFFFLKFVMHRE